MKSLTSQVYATFYQTLYLVLVTLRRRFHCLKQRIRVMAEDDGLLGALD